MKTAVMKKGYTFCTSKGKKFRIEGGTDVAYEKRCDKVEIHAEQETFWLSRLDFMIMFGDVA